MLGAKLEGLVLAKQECMTSTWERKKRARQSSYPCPAPRRKNERVFNLEGSRGLVADTGWSRKDPCMRTVLTRSSIYVADLCSQIQAHSLPRSPTCPKDCHWALSQDDCCSTKQEYWLGYMNLEGRFGGLSGMSNDCIGAYVTVWNQKTVAFLDSITKRDGLWVSQHDPLKTTSELIHWANNPK